MVREMFNAKEREEGRGTGRAIGQKNKRGRKEIRKKGEKAIKVKRNKENEVISYFARDL